VELLLPRRVIVVKLLEIENFTPYSQFVLDVAAGDGETGAAADDDGGAADGEDEEDEDEEDEDEDEDDGAADGDRGGDGTGGEKKAQSLVHLLSTTTVIILVSKHVESITDEEYLMQRFCTEGDV
jgi:Ran GTPase-activating protein (RanGAP) involved in mRNA processing and transport